MSNIPNFVTRKKKKKKKKRKKEKRGGHIIKCLLTELGRAGRENIWPLVMAHGPRCARSVRHDLGPNIFPSGPPTQSISTYYSRLGSQNNQMKKTCGIIKTLTLQELPALLQIVGYIAADYRAAD